MDQIKWVKKKGEIDEWNDTNKLITGKEIAYLQNKLTSNSFGNFFFPFILKIDN